MAGTIYPAFKAKVGDGTTPADFDTDNFKLLIVSSSYTYNAAHDFRDDVAAGILGTSANLANLAWANNGGNWELTSDATYQITASASGDITGVILFKDTGTPGTSPLVIYDAVTSTPVANGQTVTVTMPAVILTAS